MQQEASTRFFALDDDNNIAMHKTYQLVGVLLLVMVFTCSDKEPILKRDDGGILVSKPYQWRTPLSFTKTDDGWIRATLRQDIVHDGDVVLCSQPRRSNGAYVKLDTESGQILWTWEDLFPIDQSTLGVRSAYQTDNTLFFGISNRLYGIDLKEGVTEVRRETDETYREFSGTGDQLFLTVHKMLDKDTFFSAGVYQM
jgi:outer membrane protein assembly factor BamB